MIQFASDTQQILVFLVLAVTLALFVVDRFRYEGVALGALLLLILAGVVPAAEAFIGFAHPAVVTVAAVLVISRGLTNAGVVDWLARPLMHAGGRVTVQVAVLCCTVAVLSAFMNNVGALALLMPVGIRLAREHDHPPSLLLMPMAFASLLGGLTTAIGTPPNLIVASFRAGETGLAFSLFDYTPVGSAVAVSGLVFLALAGWRLLPSRSGRSDGMNFELAEYVTEASVPAGSKFVGVTLGELEEKLGEDVSVLGLVRGERHLPRRTRYEVIAAGDVLVVEGEADQLKVAFGELGFDLVGRGKDSEELLKSDDLHLVEAVVPADAWAAGRTAHRIDLRRRFGLNLLAISRRGNRITRSLAHVVWSPGDVLLMEGDRAQFTDALSNLGCLPLAQRGLNLGQPRRVVAAVGLFAFAIGLAATELLPIHVSFVLCALAMAAAGMFTAREAYAAVDWPVILLLAALIPVGSALEHTGGAAWIAHGMEQVAGGQPPAVGLAIVLVTTMCLSDVINNAAAAVLMCPVAAGLAGALGVSADPYLIAVALGASCAFLTPVGHQSNTLVMGPGGYRFGDYWRVGLPLEIIVGVVAVILIPLVWPY